MARAPPRGAKFRHPFRPAPSRSDRGAARPVRRSAKDQFPALSAESASAGIDSEVADGSQEQLSVSRSLGLRPQLPH